MENKFTLNTQMKDVEILFPYTRSTLHTQFHIGGCSKCGYEPHNTIEDVAKKYSKNPNIVLESLNQGFEDMNTAEISMDKFASIYKKNQLQQQPEICVQVQESVLIVDVREEWEFDIAHIPGSLLLTESNFADMLLKAKEASHVIVVCHHGMRSMNATLYLREHGIHHAKSLTGGIDAYSLQIDSSTQRY